MAHCACENGETTISRLGKKIILGVFYLDTAEVRDYFEDSDVPQILLQARQGYGQSNDREVRNELNDVQTVRGFFPKKKRKRTT